jgi:hypothetical protein
MRDPHFMNNVEAIFSWWLAGEATGGTSGR